MQALTGSGDSAAPPDGYRPTWSNRCPATPRAGLLDYEEPWKADPKLARAARDRDRPSLVDSASAGPRIANRPWRRLSRTLGRLRRFLRLRSPPSQQRVSSSRARARASAARSVSTSRRPAMEWLMALDWASKTEVEESAQGCPSGLPSAQEWAAVSVPALAVEAAAPGAKATRSRRRRRLCSPRQWLDAFPAAIAAAPRNRSKRTSPRR